MSYSYIRGFIIITTAVFIAFRSINSNSKPSRIQFAANDGEMNCGDRMNKSMREIFLMKHNELRRRVALGLYPNGNSGGFLPTASKMPKLKGIEEMGAEISVHGIQSLEMDAFERRIGHATQMMWEATRLVGCAIRECARQPNWLDGQPYTLAVCKYFPSGNVFRIGQPSTVYTAGAVASECRWADGESGLCILPTTK
ncbi:unnamed protein product [Caenorhabditis bovis]|uniref:SCP domain-containing protein n=1 Tax=Caenorhabditis bovis TaxID=2654633 RepID=A0A8S1EZ54_9PELO|nr:unnamed protein product [Caenorhabditis bovis]